MFFDVKVPELNEELMFLIFEKKQLRLDRQRVQELNRSKFNSVNSFVINERPQINQNIDFSNLQQMNSRPDLLLNYNIQDCINEIWLCEIEGLNERYDFKRHFYKKARILKQDNDHICSYEIFEDKLYEYCNIKNRYFFKIENSKIKPLTKLFIIQFFKEKETEELKIKEILKKSQKFNFINRKI